MLNLLIMCKNIPACDKMAMINIAKITLKVYLKKRK